MERAEYLEKIWCGYPPARSECLSLARFSQKVTGTFWWVGGQILSLSRETSEIVLAGQGHKLLLSFKPEVEGTLDPFKILQVGDWCEFRVSESSNKYTSSEWTLLVPHRERATKAPGKIDEHTRWIKFLGDVRKALSDIGLQEVQTPQLVPCPGTEPTLEPFRTQLKIGKEQKELFLPTSPELHLKKALSQGWSDIFEITKCFRNDEVSSLHQPEFWMLEWYRSFSRLEQIQDDLKNLLLELANNGWLEKQKIKIETTTIAELFQKYVGLTLTPQTSIQELLKYCENHGMSLSGEPDWNDCFHLLYVQLIEPKLAERGLLFVEKFPPSQRALARIGEDGWSDRFEFYWEGVEIANAFHELNDPVEQRKRFDEDLVMRRRYGRGPIRLDEEFLVALESGLPPASGVALGLERLYMVITKQQNLADFRLFPVT